MKYKILILALVINFATFGQKITKDVLFTINNKPFYTDEFIRVYNKNLDLVKDESQKDLNQYLDLYVGYKLKVEKANKLGLQNGEQYQAELKSYRNQLSKNYITDSKVTNELVNEAYERAKYEIKASHILILVDENADSKDTLSAYNQALDLRQRIISGQDFSQVAKEFSQDPSAKDNGGDLGYFSTFRMVYPFETAAYKTAVNEISMPIRTRFGYHIIKTTAKRDNRGELEVAHIMILKPQESENAQNPEKEINDIYKKLQQGEKFEELARQFSQDKASSNRGGVLNRFGSGQLSSEEFENVAFSLTEVNSVSKPFQSNFGWHIVKLIKKFPIKTLEESKPDLELRISKDERSRKIVQSLNQKLRKKYAIKINDKVYSQILKFTTNDFYDGKLELPESNKSFNTTLVTIDKNSIAGESFVKYIISQQKSGYSIKPIQKLVDVLYQNFVDEQLSQYYNENLEKEFPEFSAIMEEYRDGLLLFDLMEKEIWQRSKTDTIGLQNYFETQRNMHTWKKRADVLTLSSTQKTNIEKALNAMKQGKTSEEVKAMLNTNDVVNIMTSQNTYEEGADALPKNTKFEEGYSDIVKQGEYYFATKVSNIKPAGPKSLEECKGKVINDYQQYLEQNWVGELKKEFEIKVNNEVFQKVKNQLKK
jgi:peptidyl-prolyl cis-trans isomerase SurA